MRGALNIQRITADTYAGCGGDLIWRITRAPKDFTLKKGRTCAPVYWVARNGRKALYARTLFELGARLRRYPAEVT